MRQLLKRLTSNRTRQDLAFAVVKARKPTSRWRALPNLLVIGAQRCGTSSLFKYLGAHPECEPSIRKEVRFFTEYYDRGFAWYRSHFPLTFGAFNGRRKVYFEATPDYLLDPRVPARVEENLPDVRIIVLLRDPVERAYSHYWHNRRLGTENLSFEEALVREPERINAHLERLERSWQGPTPKALLRYSYVERGRYVSQLEHWFRFVDRNRVLILRSENLYKDSDGTYQQILSFLGLAKWSPESYQNFSYSSERPVIPPMPDSCRNRLERDFAAEIEWLDHLSGSPAPRKA